jgi:uncharacterized membrane protein YeiH
MDVPPLYPENLIGVAVFAASGASAAVGKRLDIFGVAFVGMVTALGGGVVRDMLIGDIPPYAFTNWPFLVVAAAAALPVFWVHPHLNRVRPTVLVLDAAGLGLFTVTGTLDALDRHIPAIGACVLGVISGIGGGLGRDLLTGEIPIVLRREIYAVAALLGAGVVATLHWLGESRPLVIAVTALLIFVVRLLAIYRKWSAPTPRGGLPDGPTGTG